MQGPSQHRVISSGLILKIQSAGTRQGKLPLHIPLEDSSSWFSLILHLSLWWVVPWRWTSCLHADRQGSSKKRLATRQLGFDFFLPKNKYLLSFCAEWRFLLCFWFLLWKSVVFPKITSRLCQLCLNVTETLGPLQRSEAAEKVNAYAPIVF